MTDLEARPTLHLKRWPEDEDELWLFIAVLFGHEIPRSSVCAGHDAPFDAFCDAYFEKTPVGVWKASRGLGGKSTLLGLLVSAEAITKGAQTTVLGGSSAQSTRVKEVTDECWLGDYAPAGMLSSDPTRFTTRFKNGAWILALMASQKSVRGPHPQKLRLDEVDEMDQDLFDASQGQPMDKVRNGKIVQAQTVVSSTHQYPDRTMTEALKRAAEKGWRVRQWCYKESHANGTGWLTDRMILQKRAEVSSAMWDIEYDLQEPSFEGRAIDTEAIERAFDASRAITDDPGTEIIFANPMPGGKYVTGIDWAKEQDWTIIATFQTNVHPWKLVAWLRIQRLAWPYMVNKANERMKRYGGWLVHDSTGIGDVVDDYIEYDRAKIEAVKMVGREREMMLNDWISAIEGGDVRMPRIQYAYNEHKYVTLKDLFGSGHPPDTFVAFACAWKARLKKDSPFVVAQGPTRVSPWRGDGERPVQGYRAGDQQPSTDVPVGAGTVFVPLPTVPVSNGRRPERHNGTNGDHQ